MLRTSIATLVCATAAIPVIAQDVGTLSPSPDTDYVPYLQQDFPNQVLFGDTHLHTAYSADAGLTGATTTPDDAYRFAKGQVVTSSNGIPARLQRPQPSGCRPWVPRAPRARWFAASLWGLLPRLMRHRSRLLKHTAG